MSNNPRQNSYDLQQWYNIQQQQQAHQQAYQEQLQQQGFVKKGMQLWEKEEYNKTI